MTLTNAKKLQKLMPYKRIYFDMVHDCYRLICPEEIFTYYDENGCGHKRIHPETLIPIHRRK